MNTLGRTLIGTFLLTTLAQAASEQIGVVGSEFDFGEVPPNATLAHQVWLGPGSRDSLRLVDIKTGCGCLTASWEETVITAGDSLSLVFYWQTRSSISQRSVSAYLYIEPLPYPVEIQMTGKVVTRASPDASFEVAPRFVDFGRNPRGKAVDTVRLTNKASSELRVSVISVGPGIAVELPEVIPVGESVKVVISKTDPNDVSPLEASTTIEAVGNSGTKQRVSIPVTFGDFSFRPEFTTN